VKLRSQKSQTNSSIKFGKTFSISISIDFTFFIEDSIAETAKKPKMYLPKSKKMECGAPGINF